MSDYLNQVVSYFVDNKGEDTSGNASEGEREQFVREAAKQNIIDRIYKEIYDAVEEDAFQAAEKKSKEVSIRRKMNEARTLIIQGFVVAFFVGLAVNQLTEIFQMIKQDLLSNDLVETIILFAVFVSICVVLLGYMLVKELIALVRKDSTE